MNSQAVDLRDILTETHTMEDSNGAKLTIRESTHGSMERFMMASGTRDSNTAMEYGGELRETRTLGSGGTQRQRAMAFTLGPMETGMRASGSSVSSMAKAPTSLPMGIFTQASIRTGNLMAKVNIPGKMVHSI